MTAKFKVGDVVYVQSTGIIEGMENNFITKRLEYIVRMNKRTVYGIPEESLVEVETPKEEVK